MWIDNILVSFDVVFLFTIVHVRETFGYIQELFSSDILELSEYILITTYFQRNNFYEQTDGITMGSPLRPVIANFYMERCDRSCEASFLG